MRDGALGYRCGVMASGRPFDRLRANGVARGVVDATEVGGGGAPPAARSPFDFPQGERTAPLWIPAFAGMAVGGVRVGGRCCWRRKFPLRREGRFDESPLRRGGGNRESPVR